MIMIYKVLLVDDEINIVQGISKLVNWTKYNAKLYGKAYHGEMALQMIMKNPPDIVLTDIKMPKLNGVQLIEKVQSHYPHIKFIILSGHDEFEFAKTAMKYGVKHYLLKPTNRTKIESALKEVIVELESEEKKEQFLRKIREDLKRVVPIAKKQFLKEFIINKSYSTSEWNEYKHLFSIDPIKSELRLIVMVIDKDHDFEHLFALNEIILEVVRSDIIHLSTIIGNKVTLLLENQQLTKIISNIKEAQHLFFDYYQMEFTTAISSISYIENVQKLYKEALDCLTQRFYLGNGSIITSDDIKKYESNFNVDTQFNYEEIVFAIRSGDVKQVKYLINEFFQSIKSKNLKVSVVKSYCLELLMSIIRQVKNDKIDVFFQQILYFQEFETLEEIQIFISTLAEEITLENFDETRKTQHKIIQKVIHYLEENLGDESLSLSKIADEIVYMNPDYLGRLFKKEIGENFSAYLIKLRIKKAIELMNESDSVKIFEVAHQVGYSNNPRYFGQVFKKHTGVTPSDYVQGSL